MSSCPDQCRNCYKHENRSYFNFEFHVSCLSFSWRSSTPIWGRNWAQISTYDIPFVESADPFIDLLTEIASRMRGQGIKARVGQKLSIVRGSPTFRVKYPTGESCRSLDATPFATSDLKIVRYRCVG